MSDPFLGQIMQVGWGFANSGWANCNGATLAISQNSALFSLLGTTFGGDGLTTFGLPDVQGRTLIGQGHGAGLAPYAYGQKAGTENTTLSQSQMPMHTHTATVGPVNVTSSLQSLSAAATTGSAAAGSMLANANDIASGGEPQIYAPASAGTAVNLSGLSVTATGPTVNNGTAGNSQPFSILQPYLAVWTLIALQGIYPSRQ